MIKTALFAFIGLAATAIAMPTDVQARDTPAIGGVVDFEVGQFVTAKSMTKDGKEAWTEIKARQFKFDGKDYVKEEFTLDLYEKKGFWEADEASSWKVVKTVKCTIETEPDVTLPRARVAAVRDEPYLSLTYGTPYKYHRKGQPLPEGFKTLSCE